MASSLFQLRSGLALRRWVSCAALLSIALLLIGARPVSSGVAEPASADVAPSASAGSRPLAMDDLSAPAANQSLELLHEMPVLAKAPAAAPVAAERPAASRPARVMWMEVTAYCGCTRCCGHNAHGVTASGRTIGYNGGHFVAADTDLLPFCTSLRIPGYANGDAVEVVDRGSAIKGHRIDVFFASHEEAKAWGRRWLAVTVGE